MFRRIGEAASFSISVVTADNVKRLKQHTERDKIHHHELERADEERIASRITYEPVEHDPANDVARNEEQRGAPIVTANSREDPAVFQCCRRLRPHRWFGQTVSQQLWSSFLWRLLNRREMIGS